MYFYKPLPTTSAGGNFEIRSKVVGVYDKGKSGSVIESQAELVDKQTGEVYSKVVGSGFAVGQGNWGGPKGMFTFRVIITEWNVESVCKTNTTQARRTQITPRQKASSPTRYTTSRPTPRPHTSTA